ncbi:MAG: M48 family metallopeptidase [Saprospirales bacterium]|jgi:predicted metal-dependent hydrolase|nr:M48 family metallopeptidase [Saprospirales bacterium]MBK7335225.1 M48 family metallopeptidase [Saprospirales bacterium]
MLRKPAKSRSRQLIFKVDNLDVPVKIVRENRRSIRFAVGKSALLVRLPHFLSQQEEDQHMERLQDWADVQFKRLPALRERFQPFRYKDGDSLVVGDRTFFLHISFEDRPSHKASLRGRDIFLSLSREEHPLSLAKAVRKLLSRMVAAHFLPEIKRRVFELNALYFQQTVKRVSLKYNSSNWGSCSAGRNINLSTRLLFAPPEVKDYIIIHELAHLVELNHSDRYWKLVSEVMPEYEEWEKWLRKNGHLCEF